MIILSPHVSTDKLTKRYGPLEALVDCSFEVVRGEVFGLLGANGAGKTTLLRLLLGYISPSSGAACIDGFSCSTQSLEVRRRTAYLPGDVRLFRSMRGRDVLNFLARLRGQSSRAAIQLADRMELDLRRRVAFMSTGMRQKLALAATLAAETPLVILDEPTSNLDPNMRLLVSQLVREARGQRRTVLLSSHVLAEVEDVCDRVAILRGGRLVHTQCLAELRERHRIHVKLEGTPSLPELPESLVGKWSPPERPRGEMTIETAGSLSAWLGWLARLPVADIRVEPHGLRAIYESFQETKGDRTPGETHCELPSGPRKPPPTNESAHSAHGSDGTLIRPAVTEGRN